MALSLGTVASSRASLGSLSFSVTQQGGSDRMMIVTTSAQDSNHANMPIVSITFNGASFTKIRHDEAVGNVRTEIWYLLNPDEGTYTLSVTATGSLGELAAGAFPLTGAKQTGIPEDQDGVTGNASSATRTLTATTLNAMGISVVSTEATISSANNGQFRQYTQTGQSYENTSGATKDPVIGDQILSWSFGSGQPYAMSAIIIAPSSTLVTLQTVELDIVSRGLPANQIYHLTTSPNVDTNTLDIVSRGLPAEYIQVITDPNVNPVPKYPTIDHLNPGFF